MTNNFKIACTVFVQNRGPRIFQLAFCGHSLRTRESFEGELMISAV